MYDSRSLTKLYGENNARLLSQDISKVKDRFSSKKFYENLKYDILSRIICIIINVAENIRIKGKSMIYKNVGIINGKTYCSSLFVKYFEKKRG